MYNKKISVENSLKDVFGDNYEEQFSDPKSRLSKDFFMYYGIINDEPKDYFKHAKFMKCSRGNEVLGVCTFSFDPKDGDDYYVLNDLEKSNSCSEKGIGTLLIKSVIAQAKKDHKDYIYLITPDFNIEFYEKFGFIKGRYSHSKKIDEDAIREFPQLKKTPERKSYNEYYMTLELKK